MYKIEYLIVPFCEGRVMFKIIPILSFLVSMQSKPLNSGGISLLKMAQGLTKKGSMKLILV